MTNQPPSNDPKSLQGVLGELQARLGELFRASPAADVERNVRAMLTQSFQRLDLVTREEFDIQSEMLARLRERVVQLERTVARLELEQRQDDPQA